MAVVLLPVDILRNFLPEWFSALNQAPIFNQVFSFNADISNISNISNTSNWNDKSMSLQPI